MGRSTLVMFFVASIAIAIVTSGDQVLTRSVPAEPAAIQTRSAINAEEARRLAALCRFRLDRVECHGDRLVIVVGTFFNGTGASLRIDEQEASASMMINLQIWPVGKQEVYSIKRRPGSHISPLRSIANAKPGETKIRQTFELLTGRGRYGMHLREYEKTQTDVFISPKQERLDALPPGTYAVTTELDLSVCKPDSRKSDLCSELWRAALPSKNIFWLTIPVNGNPASKPDN